MTVPSPHYRIGIDIGGTGIKGGLVELKTGALLGDVVRRDTPTPATPNAVADVIAAIVQQIQAQNGATGEGITTTIGVAYPGIVRNGVSRSAANLDSSWIDLDIEVFFSRQLACSVRVVNDADAAGVAEAAYGAARDVTGTVLVITLGTGIGSALLHNGNLVPNAELGHLEIDGTKAESKASAVARERAGMDWNGYSSVLQRYLSHVEFLLSPALFVIGGGISARAEEYLPRLDLNTPITKARLGNDAGIVGAALLRPTLA